MIHYFRRFEYTLTNSKDGSNFTPMLDDSAKNTRDDTDLTDTEKLIIETVHAN